MRIGIDFDGTISDNIPQKQAYVKEHYHKEISKEQTEQRILAPIIGRDNYRKMIDTIFGTEMSLRSLPVAGAKEAMQRLHQHHELYIVTRRTKNQAAYAQQWLEKNDIPYKKILYKDKADWNKEQACIEHKITVLLEDRYDQLQGSAEGQIMLFLLSRPFNQDIEVAHPVSRVNSWQGFIRIVESLTDR